MPSEIECLDCEGYGVVHVPVGEPDPGNEFCDEVWECLACKGSGWIPASELRERGEGV